MPRLPLPAVTEVVAPATGEVLARVPETVPAEVHATVEQLVAGQQAWARRSVGERAEILHAVADHVDARREELAVTEARNVGKPVNDARGEVTATAAAFRYLASLGQQLSGLTIPVDGGVDATFWEPIGVVGLITPWNFPLLMAAWKVAPALVAGNAALLKPSELTPLTSLLLEELAHEAGVPESVFRVLPGTGPVTGAAVVRHPAVGKVSFTGSTRVGREIGAEAGRRLARVALELGGKSACIVFADADLDRAAEDLPGAVFGNSGQDCCARSRVLVQRGVLDTFLALFEDATRRFVVGDPLDDATRMGPLVSAHRKAVVGAMVDDAALPVLFAGAAPLGGAWYPPTVLGPATNREPICREEVFGPVACVIPFDDEWDAIRIANDSTYGLSGSVWTADLSRALRMVRALETGTLSVNSNNSVRVTTPFGGRKDSGIGRELGPDALREYAELKNVFIAGGHDAA